MKNFIDSTSLFGASMQPWPKAWSTRDFIKAHLVSNENLKITEVVIHPRGLSDSSEVVITAHIY